MCVAGACKTVRMGARGPYAPSQRATQIVADDARKIGIRLINRSRKPEMPSSNNQLLVNVQWVQPWPDPWSFMFPLFAGPAIQPTNNVNYSLVGITAAQARRLGVHGHVSGVPSVDGDIARCNVLTESARSACWAQLDRKLTVEIAPVIPFLWRNSITILGPQVTKWAYDRSSGTTAFAHVAVRR
jgi:ABC-type transport system substrate-binding protein